MKTLTLKVQQFNNYIKNILAAEEFLTNIAIYGEVSNFKISGGNAYFDLKDEDAMLSCVKFGASDLSVANGDLITVYGRVNFYVKTGRLNFVVAKAEAYGLGELYQKFLELKSKLEAEGYFREEIKKPIPKFAKKIGVITSETGAVIRDIIHVTKSKNQFTDIVVYPSKVQGARAEDELATGIDYFNSREDVDVIIIARGGGSLEDLAPFNTEKIVKSIYSSRIPIISAVGHETDFTLSDFASDLRAPTPSVAAELAVFDYFEQINNIFQIAELNYYFITKNLSEKIKDTIYYSGSIIDKIMLKRIKGASKVQELVQYIHAKACQIYESKQAKLSMLTGIISRQNPLEILKSGYAVIEKDGKRQTKIEDFKIGDEIKITMQNGSFAAKVTKLDS